MTSQRSPALGINEGRYNEEFTNGDVADSGWDVGKVCGQGEFRGSAKSLSPGGV